MNSLAPEISSSPGVHPFSIGAREGWVLHDGTFLMPATALARGASPVELATLLGGALRPDGQLELSVNVMLVHWGRELILIDAGCGTAYGSDLGRLETSLRDAGFKPDDVTAVVFTHLHLDHIAGAVNLTTRTLRFPRARFFASRDETSFWQQPVPDLSGTAIPSEQRMAIVQGIQEALSILGPRLELFTAGETLFKGFTAVPLPGHTPFHAGFLLQAGGESLLNSGDAMSDPRLHVPHPEWAPVGDAQPVVAGNTRRALAEHAAQEDIGIFGCHFPFPGLGRVTSGLSWKGKKIPD